MQLLWSLAHVALITVGAWAVGRRISDLRCRFDSSVLQFAFCAALGLALISYLVFVLATLRLISSRSLFHLTFVLGSIGLLNSVFVLPPILRDYRKSIRFPSLREVLVLFLFLVYVIWILLCVVLPSSNRDEIIYHLEIPKQILQAGGMVFSPDNIHAYFPQLGEMLFLLGLGTAGEVGAKLYHVLAGFLLTSGLYGFSRYYLSKQNALLACALFWTVPSVMLIMPWAYVDLLYALYTFLAIATLLEYFKTGRWRWAVFAGIMAGCASATKYTGLQFLILLECILLLEHIVKRRRTWPSAAFILAVSALPLIAPYLFRNWQATGWPLFPFKIGGFILHPGINWDHERARLSLRWLLLYGAPLGKETIGHLLLSPVLVFVTGRFNSFEFFDGVIGPLFLLIPFLLARVPKPESVKWLSLFSVVFLYYWAFTTKQVRFLIPLLPVLSFLLAYGVAEMKNRLLYGLVFVFLAVNLVIGGGEVWKKNPLPFWLGKESQDEYLSRQIESYPIYRMVHQMMGPDDKVYLIHMRNYVYYLDCPWRSDFVFERYSLDRFIESASRPDDLIAFFRSRDITHLLVDEKFATSPEWGLEGKHLEMFQEFLGKGTVPLLRFHHYALYKIK